MTPPDPAQVALGLGFAILGLAVLTWFFVILRELPEGAPGLYSRISKITSFIFNAAPAQTEAKKGGLPVRVFVERLIPIILWLIIIVPMVVFPIIFIIMPILHIPWTYLLPP
ncbi:MAG: hypothetical protein ACYCQJ_11135 [Nitrososphaerales archaeon]